MASILGGLPSWAVVTMFISVAFNTLFILAAFFEPYKSVFKQAMRVWTHGQGKRVNAWMFTKSGSLKRLYKKPDEDGTIEYKNKPYSINPQSQVSDRGIPTQIYREGTNEPINIYNDDEARKLSTDELTRIMTSTKLPGIMKLLKQYWPVALVLVGTTVLMAAGSLYMNWMIYDEAVQKGTEIAARTVRNATELANQAG